MRTWTLRQRSEVLRAGLLSLLVGGVFVFRSSTSLIRLILGGSSSAPLLTFLFLAVGAGVVSLGIRAISEPYQVEMMADGTVVFQSVRGRVRVRTGEIQAIQPTKKRFALEGYDRGWFRVVHLGGFVDVPLSNDADELVSLLAKGNGGISVDHKQA